jgi:hypothetical protein
MERISRKDQSNNCKASTFHEPFISCLFVGFFDCKSNLSSGETSFHKPSCFSQETIFGLFSLWPDATTEHNTRHLLATSAALLNSSSDSSSSLSFSSF